jgi:sulfopropanediol 3-dehydrogenase
LVGKYLKTVTYQHASREGSIMLARYCKVVADAEGMAAHARTATIRLERYGTQEAGT